MGFKLRATDRKFRPVQDGTLLRDGVFVGFVDI